MAELRMVRIAIELNEGGSGGDATPRVEEQSDTGGKTKEGNVLFKSLILNQGYQTAKRLVLQSIDANLNRNFSLNEDYMGETTYQNAKNMISKMTSYASSVASATIMGASVGGFVGAVIGFGISAVGIGVSEYTNTQAKKSQYFRSLNASNIEVGYARQRAGLIDGSMGTEN